MKIHMDIISGFLGAGKTTFINSLISESKVEGERICIFQLEEGKEKIIESSNKNYQIKTKIIREIKELKEEMIFSITEFNPHRIIIEYNGTWDLNELFNMLNNIPQLHFTLISNSLYNTFKIFEISNPLHNIIPKYHIYLKKLSFKYIKLIYLLY